MNARPKRDLAAPDPIGSLLTLWGVPNGTVAGAAQAPNGPFQALTPALNQVFADASSSQAQALSATNERFAQAVQALLSARQPSDMMAAQAGLMTCALESVIAQARAWAELTQKLGGCCAALTCTRAAGQGSSAGRAAPTAAHTRSRRPPAKAATRGVGKA